jgi:hypothetical protein
MNKFSTLLQEIIDAGANATLELAMESWVCDTSCCACGDVAVARKSTDLVVGATKFAQQLRVACADVFDGCTNAAFSVYSASRTERVLYAEDSLLFNDEELNHSHLTSDNSDRRVLHDYLRILIEISEEKTS